MAYKLERIAQEGLKKIMADMKDDPRKLKTLELYTEPEDYNFKSWAIDREADSYLFSGPNPGMPDPINTYTFFYKKQFYWLERSMVKRVPGDIYGHVIWFDQNESGKDIEKLSVEELSELKNAIKQAFTVYKEAGRLNLPYEHEYCVAFEEEV